MPELAEVLYFSRQWRDGRRQKITRIHLNPGKRVFRGTSPDQLRRSLTGRSLTSIRTHGKRMLFRWGSEYWLGIHLGMTGSLSSEIPKFRPTRHDHLVLYTRARALVFRDPRLFGKIKFQRSLTPPFGWVSLPPEVTSPQFSRARLKSILQRRRRTPLKPLLLLQDLFPGIGNWMADEILWRVRIDPRTRSGEIQGKVVDRLHFNIRQVACRAIHTIGRNGSDPPRSWLFPHRWKDGGQCPRCRQSLVRQPVGGRTTCWCPGCQKPILPRAQKRA